MAIELSLIERNKEGEKTDKRMRTLIHGEPDKRLSGIYVEDLEDFARRQITKGVQTKHCRRVLTNAGFSLT